MNNDDIVDILNDLIETSKDGEYGFRSGAEVLKATDARLLFQQRADVCRQSAAELQVLVRQRGGKAEDSGSAGAAMHRGWVAVKGTLAGYSDTAILEEAERGEDSAIETYRKALANTNLPSDVRALIERHHEGAMRTHAQVRVLRDRARAASV